MKVLIEAASTLGGFVLPYKQAFSGLDKTQDMFPSSATTFIDTFTFTAILCHKPFTCDGIHAGVSNSMSNRNQKKVKDLV